MEAIIDTLAAPQHGVVTRTQLRESGLTRGVLDRRVRSGRLRPVHRGVYVVGAVVPREASAMAACLACGTGAWVSHLSAAELRGLVTDGRRGSPVDVSIREGNRRPEGVRVHRVASLRSDEVTRLHRIPITTTARTLLDLASVLGGRELERAVAEARARRLIRPGELEEMLARHRGWRGTATLRAILEAGPAFTRSEAEERFLALLRRAGAPEPEVNARVEGLEVDFLWRPERLIVEIDGYASHSSPQAFARDRLRDSELVAAGHRVIRFTWAQVTTESDGVLFRLGRALAVGS